ncbi:MAG: nucleotidyltransferase domain-containing protein [Rhodoplanes sp.]
MNRETVITRIKQIEERLRRLGVARLYLYGSYARDEARPDSDIDVLVDFAADDARERDLEGFFAPTMFWKRTFPAWRLATAHATVLSRSIGPILSRAPCRFSNELRKTSFRAPAAHAR